MITRYVIKLHHKRINTDYNYRIVRETVYDNGHIREEETVDQAVTLDDAIAAAERFNSKLD